MTQQTTELKEQVIELTEEAFETFCSDLAGMFGVGMNCEYQDTSELTHKELKKIYKNITAVNFVKAQGRLDGDFHLIFDKNGLFTLGGIIVMLPKKKIEQNKNTGDEKQAQEMEDAISEVGNLLVGSWDKVFRENLPEHKHFKQTRTYIGNPWLKPEKEIGLSKDTPSVYVEYEITVNSYEPFKCGALFPKSFFETQQSEQKSRKEQSNNEQEPQSQTQQEQTEQPANPQQPQSQSESSDQTQPQTEPENQQAPSEAEKTETDPKPQIQQTQENTEQNEQQEQPDQTQSMQNNQEPTAQPPQTEQQPEQQNSPIAESIKRMTESSAALPGQAAVIPDQITAEQIMDKNIVWAKPEQTVEHALYRMQQNDVGYILVGDEKKLLGLISKSDLSGALSPYLKQTFSKWQRTLDQATLKIKLKWIMSRPVRTINPQTSISNLTDMIVRSGHRCLPVVDSKGNAQGIVTVFDILRLILDSQPDSSCLGRTPQSPPLD